jgi:hypothetical protein
VEKGRDFECRRKPSVPLGHRLLVSSVYLWPVWDKIAAKTGNPLYGTSHRA